MPKMKIFICIIAYIYYVVSSNDNCPKNIPKSPKLVHYGAHCYEFILTRQSTWFKAQENCMSKNGFLLDIQSSIEYFNVKFLYEALRKIVQVDTGVWIGLKFSPEKNWHWNSSVSKMYYTHWYPGQPIFGNGEDCGLMQNDGFWHDYPCAQNYSWICKYSAVVNDKCPYFLVRNENLRQFFGYCYQFVLNKKKSWYNAYWNCKHSGGKLVDIKKECDFLFRSWQELRYQDENDTMLWTDKKNSKRKHRIQLWYSSGQQIANLETCGRIDSYGQIGRIHGNECQKHHGFICKYSTRTTGYK